MRENLFYFSDKEIEELGYKKDGLVWIICEEYYTLEEATADGYWFHKIKKPKYYEVE